nr:SH3 domain-containing protein [Brevibacillus laterosporus]
MFLRVHTILIAVCFLLLLIPQSFAQAATHVEVTVDQLNIRSAPGTTNQIVGTITRATRLPILTEKNDWIQVKLANGKTGWVLHKYVKKLEIPQVKYVKSNVDMLNVRAEPNATAQILQIIDQNGVFLQIKKQGDWAQIKLSDNVSGWVNARFLTETAAPTPKPIPNPVPVSTPVPSLASPEPVVPLPSFVTENGQVAGTIVLSESYDVYVEPNVLSTVIGQLPVNTTINHYGYTNDWYKISFNGTDAYIFKPVAHEGAVQGQPSDIPGAPTPNTGQAEAMIRVKNPDTNLRSGPGTNYAVVGNVQPGQVFPVVQSEGDWYEIQLTDNSTAYIASWIVDRVQPGINQPANVPNTSGVEYNTGMIGNETVYIYHTHNRESWRNVARNTSGSSVDDPQINITLVGKRLGELLQAHGIQAMVNQDDFAKKLAEQKKSYSLSYAESYKAVSAGQQ